MIPYLDDKLYWFSTIRLLSNNDARKSIVYRASKIHQRPLFSSAAYHVRSMRLSLFYYFHTCSYLFYTIMRAGHIDWRCIQTDRITWKSNRSWKESNVTKTRRKDYNVVHVGCIKGTKRILRDKRRNKWINTALLIKRHWSGRGGTGKAGI